MFVLTCFINLIKLKAVCFCLCFFKLFEQVKAIFGVSTKSSKAPQSPTNHNLGAAQNRGFLRMI